MWVVVGILVGWVAGLTWFFWRLRHKLPLRLGEPPGTSGGLRYWRLVRFNPFSDTGGDHSFILTLLDDQKNGIILTSLHGRGVTRFYAKSVSGGQADQELSEEEKKALKET